MYSNRYSISDAKFLYTFAETIYKPIQTDAVRYTAEFIIKEACRMREKQEVLVILKCLK